MSKKSEQLNNLNSIATAACKLSIAAGQLVKRMLGAPVKIQEESGSLVTQADLAAQKLITCGVQAKYPNHGFLVEEEDSTLPQERDVTWIIDPIDGTINFSRGQPVFAVSIAIAIQGQLQIGVIYDPIHAKLYKAVVGQGIYMNGKQCAVSSTHSLKDAVLGCDWNRNGELKQTTVTILGDLVNNVQAINIFGSASLALAWVAAGHMDAYFNLELNSWDVAAGAVLIKEAGGVISHISGQPWDWLSNDKTCLASNHNIHMVVNKVLQERI